MFNRATGSVEVALGVEEVRVTLDVGGDGQGRVNSHGTNETAISFGRITLGAEEYHASEQILELLFVDVREVLPDLATPQPSGHPERAVRPDIPDPLVFSGLLAVAPDHARRVFKCIDWVHEWCARVVAGFNTRSIVLELSCVFVGGVCVPSVS